MIIVTQTPEDMTRTTINRAMMSETELEIARLLQALAFADRPEQLAEHCSGEFTPAPLYVSQAVACRNNLVLRARLKKLL